MRNIPDKRKPFWTWGKAPNSDDGVKKPSGEPEDGTSEGCGNKEVGRAVLEHRGETGDRHDGRQKTETVHPWFSLLHVDIHNVWEDRGLEEHCPGITYQRGTAFSEKNHMYPHL